MAGFVAAGGPLYEQASLAGCCVVGTALCSSSAAALNQIIERDRDALMKRTQQRPLVTGALSVSEAKSAAAILNQTRLEHKPKLEPRFVVDFSAGLADCFGQDQSSRNQHSTDFVNFLVFRLVSSSPKV